MAIFTQCAWRPSSWSWKTWVFPGENSLDHGGLRLHGFCLRPMALDDAVRKGRIHSGDLVVLVGSGVGYNQAGAALRMP